MTIKRRIERLERSDSRSGVPEKLAAALKEAEADPEGARQRFVQSANRCIGETEVALRDGDYVSPMELRLTEAYRAALRDDAERSTP